MCIMVIEEATGRAGIIKPEEAKGYKPWFEAVKNNKAVLCWVSQDASGIKHEVANISRIEMSDKWYPITPEEIVEFMETAKEIN